jgi:microcystin-dependent protein
MSTVNIASDYNNNDWSLFPATSNIDLGNNDITSIGGLYFKGTNGANDFELIPANDSQASIVIQKYVDGVYSSSGVLYDSSNNPPPDNVVSWANFPALSDVDLASHDIINGGQATLIKAQIGSMNLTGSLLMTENECSSNARIISVDSIGIMHIDGQLNTQDMIVGGNLVTNTIEVQGNFTCDSMIDIRGTNTSLKMECNNSTAQYYQFYCPNNTSGGLSEGVYQAFSYNNSSNPIDSVYAITPQTNSSYSSFNIAHTLNAPNADITDLTVSTINNLPYNPNPAGTMLMFASNSVPTGYLLCDGSPVSRSTYSSLFSVISTCYGTGDGTTTFNLPDMVQRFPFGGNINSTASVNTGGSPTISLTSDQLPMHGHGTLLAGSVAYVDGSGGTPISSTATGKTTSDVLASNGNSIRTLEITGISINDVYKIAISCSTEGMVFQAGQSVTVLGTPNMPSYSADGTYTLLPSGSSLGQGQASVGSSSNEIYIQQDFNYDSGSFGPSGNITINNILGNPISIIPSYTVVNYIIKY